MESARRMAATLEEAKSAFLHSEASSVIFFAVAGAKAENGHLLMGRLDFSKGSPVSFKVATEAEFVDGIITALNQREVGRGGCSFVNWTDTRGFAVCDPNEGGGATDNGHLRCVERRGISCL